MQQYTSVQQREIAYNTSVGDEALMYAAIPQCFGAVSLLGESRARLRYSFTDLALLLPLLQIPLSLQTHSPPRFFEQHQPTSAA